MPERVVGRVFEAFGERRVVEDHLDEGVDGPTRHQEGLSRVHELGRALADAVTPEELPRAAIEEQLDDAVLVADDLATRVVAVERATDDVVDLLLGARLLAEADAAHLRDRVNAE